MRRKYWNDPTLSLHFSDYTPFEEDFNLHLNKLEFPSCKKWLFQVWLKLGRCIILKNSFQYANVKIVSSIVSPTLTIGNHNTYKLKSALSQKAFMQIWAILAQLFKGKTFFNDLGKVLHFCDYLPFEKDMALNLNNLDIPLPKDDSFQVWLKLACWFWRRSYFFNINICKYGFPYYGPSPPLGTMMGTILNLHYIRKLLWKYELFWLSGSGEEDFSLTQTNFCIFVIISPLKRTWPLIWTI
jgi:hypothetical protein